MCRSVVLRFICKKFIQDMAQTIVRSNLHVEYNPLFGTNKVKDWLQCIENEVNFFQTTVEIYGKQLKVKRQHAAYGDDGLVYHFSGASVTAKPWLPFLKEIQQKLWKLTNERFNYVLINKYVDGKDYISFHRDNETDLVAESSIATISLGVVRDFILRKETKNGYGIHEEHKITVPLSHGSLLIMKHPTNKYWLHSVPVRKTCKQTRYSLTFRHLK